MAAVGSDGRRRVPAAGLTVADHQHTSAGSSSWLHGRRRSVVVLGVTIAVFVPVLVATSMAHPTSTGDIALIELLVRDVASRQTPRVGAYSRFGWDHPGPAAFWIMAAPYRLLGGSAAALSAAAALTNAAVLMAALHDVAKRGVAALVALLVAVLALGAGLHDGAMSSPWNVTLTNLAVVLVIVTAWGTVQHDAGSLTLMSLTATFVIQSHVGAGVVVAPVVVGAFGIHLRRRIRRRTMSDVRPVHRMGLAVAVLLWLPPVTESLLDRPGNLSDIVRWSLSNDEPSVGWVDSARLIGRTSSATFLREPSLEAGVLLDIDSIAVGVLPGLALVALTAATWTARSRSMSAEFALCVLLGVTWVSGFIAAANIAQPLGWWLVQWLQPLGWLTWMAVLLVTWRGFQQRHRTHCGRSVHILAGLSTVVVFGLFTISTLRDDRPTSPTADHLETLSDAIEERVGSERFRIEVAGEPLLADAMRSGLFVTLARRGLEDSVCAPQNVAFKHAAHRTCQDADAPVLVLRHEDCEVPTPTELELLERVDPLSPTERRELDDLTANAAVLLREVGRSDLVPLLVTPLVSVLTHEAPTVIDDRNVARMAELRNRPGDRYGLYAAKGAHASASARQPAHSPCA